MQYKSIILSIIGFSFTVKTNGMTESPIPTFQTFSPTLSSSSPITSPTSSLTENVVIESPTMVPATLSSSSPTTSPTSSPTASPTFSPTASSTLEIVEREIINDISSASDEINHAILLKCIVLFNTVCILLRYV